MKKISLFLIAVILVSIFCSCHKPTDNASSLFSSSEVALQENTVTSQPSHISSLSSGISSTEDISSAQSQTQSTLGSSSVYSGANANSSKKVPANHVHKYKDELVLPTCTVGGHTIHTCSCGHMFKQFYSEPVHKYGDPKTVYPTKNSKGYKEYTCTLCGDVYREDYAGSLTDPGFLSSYDENYNIGMDGLYYLKAGIFYPHPKGEAQPVYKGETDYDSVVGKLNGYIFDLYLLRFFRNGIGQNDNSKLGTAKIVKSEQNVFGLTIMGWRKTAPSQSNVTHQLNSVLEAMYYFTGSREVAYALWKFTDDNSLKGGANTDNYGFHDVEILANGGIIEMNGIQIELDNSVSGQVTYWFIQHK